MFLQSGIKRKLPVLHGVDDVLVFTQAMLKSMRLVRLEVRWWNRRAARMKRGRLWKWEGTKRKMIQSRGRKGAQLSSLNPPPSPLFLSASCLLCVTGVNCCSDQDYGHSILLHTLSHTTVSVARAGSRSVHVCGSQTGQLGGGENYIQGFTDSTVLLQQRPLLDIVALHIGATSDYSWGRL